MTPSDASSYQFKLSVSKNVLLGLFIFTTIAVALFLRLAPAFVGGFEGSDVLTLLSAIPQILTPLFILSILLLSEWQRKKGHYKMAWNINLFGLIGTLISISSILI